MVPGSPLPSRASCIASTVLQVALGLVILFGPFAGESPFRLYGVAILVVPVAVQAACDRRLGAARRLWIAVGLTLHPFGAMYDLYPAIWWWDHLTHAASATLLAGLGFLLVRGLRPTPGRFAERLLVHGSVLTFVVVAGVGWEIYEQHVSHLTVYGPADTRADLAFDLVGWAVVASTHRRLLGRLPDGLASRLAAVRGRSPLRPGAS